MRARRQKVAPSERSSFVYRVKTAPRFRFDRHLHPEHELTLIVRSRGTRWVGDSREDYADGDLVLIGPDVPHTWDSSTATRGPRTHRAVVVQFTRDFLGERLLQAPELENVRGLLDRSARGLVFSGPRRDLASRRLVSMAQLDGLARLLRLLEVLEILAGCERTRPLASSGYGAPARVDRHRRIDRVFNWVSERSTRPISQAEAAAVVHLSPGAFSRFFKRETGRTFVAWLAELRVRQACRLLVETDLSVTEVALEAGFNNLSNFHRRFRAITGETPRAWRRRRGGAG